MTTLRRDEKRDQHTQKQNKIGNENKKIARRTMKTGEKNCIRILKGRWNINVAANLKLRDARK